MTVTAELSDHPALERKAVAAVILGNALEFYDFTTYAFFATSIGESFFPSKDPVSSLLSSLAIFGIGFATRPIGGIVIGAFADRAGRKPAMVLTIAMMAVGMLMLAATPGYATIGVWAQVLVISGRLIQGFALGGEVGPSTAYLLEAAPPDHRGFIASWQIASQGIASLLAGTIGFLLAVTLDKSSMQEWGWRIPFLVGVAIVPVGLVIRNHLPETAGASEDAAAAASSMDVLKRLFRDHGRMLLLNFLVIMAATVSNFVGTNMPTYAKSTLGLSLAASTGTTIALGAASVVFPLAGGWLADRIGRRPVMIVPRVAIVILAIPAFWFLTQQPTPVAIYGVTFLLSALSSINAAAVIVGIPESLPRAVRSAGLSIVYAFSVTVFGGTTNYIINKLIAVTGDKLAPAYYLVVMSVIGAVAAFLMPETRGRSLD